MSCDQFLVCKNLYGVVSFGAILALLWWFGIKQATGFWRLIGCIAFFFACIAAAVAHQIAFSVALIGCMLYWVFSLARRFLLGYKEGSGISVPRQEKDK